MKILLVHNFHRKESASGDDLVFKNEANLLEKHGNEVIKYTVSNDEFDNSSILKKIKMTFGMLWSFKNYNNIKSIIDKEKPDLIHIHTFFPLLSPSILYAAKRSGCKVVTTLHDTRFICPCATSLCKNKICNKCGDGKYFRMIKNKCFKNSRLQSFWVAIIFKYHRIRKSFYNQIDKYICLNENQIELLKGINFSENKIVKKYNFVEDFNIQNNEIIENLPKKYVVFYGRIGEEKGIRILEQIWDKIDNIPLVVMGGGPLEEEFKKWSINKKNVFFLGYTQHEKCLKIVKDSEFVVFPSIWYEGCSMVEIETMSLGKALVATDLGFSSEAIRDEYNGFKVKLGDIDSFTNIINNLWNSHKLCVKLGINSRIEYEKKYLAENNYSELMDIYKQCLER